MLWVPWSACLWKGSEWRAWINTNTHPQSWVSAKSPHLSISPAKSSKENRKKAQFSNRRWEEKELDNAWESSVFLVQCARFLGVINECFPLMPGIDSSVSIVCVYKGITSRIWTSWAETSPKPSSLTIHHKPLLTRWGAEPPEGAQGNPTLGFHFLCKFGALHWSLQTKLWGKYWWISNLGPFFPPRAISQVVFVDDSV